MAHKSGAGMIDPCLVSCGDNEAEEKKVDSLGACRAERIKQTGSRCLLLETFIVTAIIVEIHLT